MKGDCEQYEVLWPRGRRAITINPLARRSGSLENQTIGELWDGLFRGNEIFPMLREGLSRQYPGVKFVPWTDFPRDGDHGFPDWNVHPGLLSEKGCDMVIVGTGA